MKMGRLFLTFIALLLGSVQGQSYFSQQIPSNEVLGNFFNGNSPATAQVYSSPQPPQLQFENSRPQQNFGFGGNSNYVNSPAPSSSIPRQSHFFGNNYDFFRQFHNDAPAQRPSSFSYQPYRSSPQPTYSSNVVGSSPSASPSFTSTQFFGSQPQPNSYTHAPQQPSQSPYTTYTQTPSQPTYSQPPVHYNGYEDAAKALGLSHGLRVITTETLKSKPAITVQSIPSQSVISSTQASPTAVSPSTLPALEEPQDNKLPEELQEPKAPSTTPVAPTPAHYFPDLATQRTPSPVVRIHHTGTSIAFTETTPTPPRISSTAAPQTSPTAIIISQRQPLYTQEQRAVNNEFIIRRQPTDSPSTTARPTSSRGTRPPPPPQTRPTQPPTRATRPPPPPPSPTPTQYQPQLYNANHLVPGQLYSNTNGAYQAYYGGGPTKQQVGGGGLEEIEPQLVDFTFPQKMLPLLEEQHQQGGFDPFRPPRYESFNPLPQQQLQARQQPPSFPTVPPSSPIAIIVTEATPTPASPSTTAEVIRVGPKGRLLKKKRKIRPQQKQLATAPQPSIARATTYRPAPTPEEEEEDTDSRPQTTYRSRFRFSPTTSTTSEPALASVQSQDEKQLIQARLKSVERQIRFRTRSKNS